MAKIEQLEPTRYLGNINSTDTRQANRLIILANGEMYEYDLTKTGCILVVMKQTATLQFRQAMLYPLCMARSR